MTRELHLLFAAELETAIAAVRAAGIAVRQIYERDAYQAYSKSDGSPVTDADLEADRIIREAIARHFPDDAILTEEVEDDAARLGAARCWIADPIDGTAQFIARTGRFDCMLALIVAGRPVVAAISHPFSGTILAAVKATGAFLERDGHRRIARFAPSAGDRPLRIASSIWFGLPALKDEIDRVAEAAEGVATGPIEVGIRPIELIAGDRTYDALIGPVSDPDTSYGGEWDFAAADLIIHEAGGVMSDLLGRPHRYNKPAVRNRGGLIVACDPVSHTRIVAAASAGVPESLRAEAVRELVTVSS